MKFIPTLLFIASLSGVAHATSYTVYSSVNSVALPISGSDVPFSLQKFNASLGTLTEVKVSVVDSALTGSFSVTNAGLTGLIVDKVVTQFTVTEQTSLGYVYVDKGIPKLLTTPTSKPSATINPGQMVTFSITSSQGYSVADQNISSGFFSAYSSVDGTGDVKFDVFNYATVMASGSVFTVDSTNTTTSTKMAITYTYTPAVPEPASALLGGIGFLTLLRRRRR